MDIYSLIILLVIFIIALQFWRLRGISEHTVAFAQRYCQKEGLQYISLARHKTRLQVRRAKPDWQVEYQMEFSSDGETQYIGTISTHGKQILAIELPVFRMAS